MLACRKSFRVLTAEGQERKRRTPAPGHRLEEAEMDENTQNWHAVEVKAAEVKAAIDAAKGKAVTPVMTRDLIKEFEGLLTLLRLAGLKF